MTSSTLLYSAAALMALSGILMAVSASPALGAVLLAAGGRAMPSAWRWVPCGVWPWPCCCRKNPTMTNPITNRNILT